jgi:predicted dienelactone hydrolase
MWGKRGLAVGVFFVGVCVSVVMAKAAPPGDYDPLWRPAHAAKRPAPQEFTVPAVPDTRPARPLPLRVYLPAETTPAPVILFSHGLGGSRTMNRYLPDHWSARGYAVVMLQHPGSDDSVWKDLPLRQRMTALQQAASADNFQARVQDVRRVLDQLETWHADQEHALNGRLNLKLVGMSGHSFGAVTTQAISGQAFFGQTRLTDPRIRAAVAMSPSPPRAGSLQAAFRSVKIPWLLLTGTQDDSPIGDTTPADRLKVFPELPAGQKYELVLKDAEHFAFSESAIAGKSMARNPNHHRAILAVSTAFWDSTLGAQDAARRWIDSESSVRSILESDDRWQRK